MSIDINWAFGFSKDVKNCVHSLCLGDRNALFLASSHNGVIYDFEHRKQTLLQGHCNMISCCAIDKTKRWIVTADSGKDAIIIVWDTFTYLPVKIYNSPDVQGVFAVGISDDGSYIATLSKPVAGEQELCVWAWSADDSDGPLLRSPVPMGQTFHEVKFSPNSVYQMVTTSESAVYFWDWSKFSLEAYRGRISKTDVGFFGGEFTASILLPDTDISLTSTSHGYIIVWESKKDHSKHEHHEEDLKGTNGGASAPVGGSIKTAVKVVRLLECGVNVMEVTANKYLVLGCQDGAVRFYDFYLRLEAWFEDLNAGPITSLSFAVQECPYPYGEAGQPGLRFWVSDFIVATRKGFVVGVESSIFDEVRRENRRGTLLMQGLSDEVVSIAAHPSQAQVAFLCRSGTMQIWNYELKLLMNVREFVNPAKDKDKEALAALERPLTAGIDAMMATNGQLKTLSAAAQRSVNFARDIAYHPSGLFLAIGFASGSIKFLSESTLQDIQSFSPSLDSIEKLKFSASGNFLAASDEHNHVLLFKREVDDMEWAGQSSRKGFIYVGRIRSHASRILGLEFGFKEGVETLISVSEDRFCVEYDLMASSMSAGVVPIKTVISDGSSLTAIKLESWVHPTCVLWHPKRAEDVEDKFLAFNTEFKVREFNADSKQCRKTCLAPRFGAPVQTAMVLPSSTLDPKLGKAAYVFSTGDRIVGLGQLPIDGDPTKVLAVVAHPAEITGFTVSCDGRFIFSAGGHDLTVNMWSVNNPMEQQYAQLSSLDEMLNQNAAAAGKIDVAPFLDLLEGGPGGELHQNLIDYFYYCQLRHGGEDTIEERTLTGVIPLEEIPALMRAVGFYPSEEEILHMLNEVRYKQFMVTGKTQDFIGLEELIRLYVNHRPVVPLEREKIRKAVGVIAEFFDHHSGSIPWKELQELLAKDGEKIDTGDLETYLSALLGEGLSTLRPGEHFDGGQFASRILGFEDN